MKDLYLIAGLACGKKLNMGIRKVNEDEYESFASNAEDARKTRYILDGNKFVYKRTRKVAYTVCDDVIYSDKDEDDRFEGEELINGQFDLIKYTITDFDETYYFYPDGKLHVLKEIGKVDGWENARSLGDNTFYDTGKTYSLGEYEINGNFIRLKHGKVVEFWWYHEGYIYTSIYVSDDLLDKLIAIQDNLETDTRDDALHITSDNVLRRIYLECPNILNDRRLLKAYLSDFLYANKTLLNVLLLSFDEGIPQEIAQTKTNDGLQLARMKKKLIISYAISDSVADQVIKMWVEAIKGESDFV